MCENLEEPISMIRWCIGAMEIHLECCFVLIIVVVHRCVHVLLFLSCDKEGSIAHSAIPLAMFQGSGF